MNARRRQTGMSIPGILSIMVMVGFFIMCTIRMAPPYFEYLTVKDFVGRIAMEPETMNMSIGQIRRKLANVFNTNQVYELDPRDVGIYRKKGKTYIDASYEVRIPIGGRIDAMLKFDDLHYEVGNPKPLESTPATKK